MIIDHIVSPTTIVNLFTKMMIVACKPYLRLPLKKIVSAVVFLDEVSALKDIF